MANNDKALLPASEQAREMAKMGDGNLFVRRDEKGVMTCVQSTRVLSAVLGEIVQVQGKWIPQVPGYHKLNQVANVSFLSPPVLVDGVLQSNPYVERDDVKKTPLVIWVRKIAIGYSPLGNLVVIDKSVYFNIHTYFLQDLQSKIKNFPACGFLGKADRADGKFKYSKTVWKKSSSGKKYPEKGEEQEGDFVRDTWEFVPISGNVGVWVDISHKEIDACYDSHVQRQKFGVRHAQSICERNCLKAHPAVAVTNVGVKDGFSTVQVFGWKHDLSLDKMNKIAKAVVDGENLDEQKIKVESSTDTPTLEEVDGAAASEGDEFGNTPEKENSEEFKLGTDKEPAKELTPEQHLLQLKEDLNTGIKIIGEKKLLVILEKAFGVKTTTKIKTLADKEGLLKLINLEVDKANKGLKGDSNVVSNEV